ncbi:hypothetical protein NQ315_008382 [Exocentrus adspersus]|uniref:Uncharacterized protein n=1 Tax=Exocentrus adspersus TaxID=1586481 RepID=A0AAV8VRN8_9CUCU|nr:hypothetical protein NQ315_008382 [Exocentrus adspersus]
MKLSTFCLMLILYTPLPSQGQRLVPPRKYHSDDDHGDNTDDVDDEEFRKRNFTDEKGISLGAPCEFTCSPKLMHVYCNPVSGMCECEKKYPVKLNNPYAGCSKPKKLGDQCYYREACEYTDQHSSCIQIHHNAVCQCKTGYHSVSIQKPSKRLFCAEDVVVIASDFSTFAGVLSGIAVLSGLICFVLHLFNQNLYGTRHRHRFGNANLAPPILFSSDPDFKPSLKLESGRMRDPLFQLESVIDLKLLAMAQLQLWILLKRNSEGQSLEHRTSLSLNAIMEMQNMCINTTYFQLDDELYQQEFGVAMGSPLSPVISDIFMKDFEKRSIDSYNPKRSMWVR